MYGLKGVLSAEEIEVFREELYMKLKDSLKAFEEHGASGSYLSHELTNAFMDAVLFGEGRLLMEKE